MRAPISILMAPGVCMRHHLEFRLPIFYFLIHSTFSLILRILYVLLFKHSQHSFSVASSVKGSFVFLPMNRCTKITIQVRTYTMMTARSASLYFSGLLLFFNSEEDAVNNKTSTQWEVDTLIALFLEKAHYFNNLNKCIFVVSYACNKKKCQATLKYNVFSAVRSSACLKGSKLQKKISPHLLN